MFVFELPTTGSISFGDLSIDKANAYTARIADATSARANVRAILKESKHSDSEKDYLRVVKVLDDYLPHVYAIINCLAADELLLRNDPLFSWRSMLSSNTFNASPRMNFPGMHSDLVFTLLTYAFALCNMSASIVSSLENYERERHISDAERQLKDERLNFAVTLLCRSNGIFTHVAEVILPQLVGECDSASGLPRIPDLSKEVVTALAKLCLADAQSLAIRKLLSKSAHAASLTPGPPLPKSHPSPALLAKLYLHVSTLYSSAHSLAKTPFSSGRQQGGGASTCRRAMEADVNADITRYLAEQGALATALAHKWLGVEAGEAGKCGEAVAYLSWAHEELQGVKEGKRKMPHLGGGSGGGKESKEKKKERKERVVEETEHVSLFLDTYKRENNSVHFHKVPLRTEISSLIPTGWAAIAMKPYSAPAPAFGPGSIDRVTAQASGLSLEQEGGIEAGTTARYAGAGSYF
ncbi:hypothetical protein BS47DRAFT_74370 [Hydnum rufescens UP504]|uniref:pH-response regulator protein palC n=1 Tax=Hydnum rufescens UP504 TaxID=1448309 RepID=A0A9P6B7N5_9AGAM|nr:hypothetical protein BS47DRAFT_74370 [Hydnum rufescens UP504]